MILVQGRIFELVYEVRKGWQPEAMKERYSEVLDRYDYVVGDWGFHQLRLKGFYAPKHRMAIGMNRFETIEDYLYEFCTIGCSFFVLRRMDEQRAMTSEPLDEETASTLPYRWREGMESRRHVARETFTKKKEESLSVVGDRLTKPQEQKRRPLAVSSVPREVVAYDLSVSAPRREERPTSASLNVVAEEGSREPSSLKRQPKRVQWEEDDYLDDETFERKPKRATKSPKHGKGFRKH